MWHPGKINEFGLSNVLFTNLFVTYDSFIMQLNLSNNRASNPDKTYFPRPLLYLFFNELSVCPFKVTNDRCSHLKENNTSDFISLLRSALFHRQKRTLYGRDRLILSSSQNIKICRTQRTPLACEKTLYVINNVFGDIDTQMQT